MAVDAVLGFKVRSNTKPENIRLMNDGFLLGNISGKGIESVSIVVKKDEFKKTYKKHGRNLVLKLESPDQNNYEVMVKAIQTNPKSNDYHHVDFQKVVFTDAIKAEVAVKYTGTEFLQPQKLVLSRLVDVVPVSGLPQDIPHVIEYDLSKSQAGDNIFAGDLTLPEGINLELDEKQLIGSIIAV